MHQRHHVRLRRSVPAFGVALLLLLLGAFVNLHPAATAVSHELVRMSEMRTQLAEAKLSAFKQYFNFSH